jgi:hypothetical protein
MAVLYKRCNGLWRHLIRRRLTHRVWAPLVELTRRRHLRFRERLALLEPPAEARAEGGGGREADGRLAANGAIFRA